MTNQHLNPAAAQKKAFSSIISLELIKKRKKTFQLSSSRILDT